jgi:hypothetical protein
MGEPLHFYESSGTLFGLICGANMHQQLYFLGLCVTLTVDCTQDTDSHLYE